MDRRSFLQATAALGLAPVVPLTSAKGATKQTVAPSVEAVPSLRLFGCGTGNLSLPSPFSGPVLWIRNNSNVDDWCVQKVIFGWSGADPIRLLTQFNTSEPLEAGTPVQAFAEQPSTDPADFLGYKWNGEGNGMQRSIGGFPAIIQRIPYGNTVIPIDGGIILGPDNSIGLHVDPPVSGDFSASIIFSAHRRDDTAHLMG